MCIRDREEEYLNRNLRGGILEEDSSRRNPWDGILEEEAGKRNPEGGFLEEESQRRNPGGRFLEEGSKKGLCGHFRELWGDTQEPSEGIWDPPGSIGTASWRWNHCVVLSKVAREQGDMPQVPHLCTKVDGRGCPSW